MKYVIYAIIIFLQFAVPLWVKSNIEKSVELKYSKLLEEYKYTIKVREQAARVSEYLALAENLKENSQNEDYERVNQLSWELAMWLPSDIYREMTQAITKPSQEVNELTVVIKVRKLLLGDDAGDLTSEQIAHHAPGIGKNNQE